MSESWVEQFKTQANCLDATRTNGDESVSVKRAEVFFA
jgi:hypothetical protein